MTEKVRKATLWADQVIMLLPHEPEPHRSAESIGQALGLSVNQVYQAIAEIKEQFPADSLVSTPRGYRFTEDATEVRKFQRSRAKSAHTTMSRAWSGTVKPYLEKTADPAVKELVEVQVTRVLEDIGRLM